MKKIEAFLKSHRLDNVLLALHRVEGLTGVTVTDARGIGRGKNVRRDPNDLHQIARIETFCTDDMVDAVTDAIMKAAHTGLHGDGKIYVIPVEEAVRIASGERGESAV
ncbi:MAG: P-II family nitrogen regulator [Verrucomicrobia bacterium]|nr:P-II family nitrogen regulator [Verrucomicrobiota bacterium]